MNSHSPLPSSTERSVALVMALCVGLTSCQRPAQKLPPAPMFTLTAAPPLVQKTESPPKVPERVAAPFVGSTIVYFQGDGITLDVSAKAVLDQQAEWLLRNPRVTASLQGHADLFGNSARQFAIGEMRAEAMRRYLVARGVGSQRIQVTSFGKQKPVATMLDQESQRQNQRGETIFTGVAGLR